MGVGLCSKGVEMAVKKIGENMDVIFSDDSVRECKITGRNWWGEKFISYIVRVNRMDLTVNEDGTCQWSIVPK